MTRTSIFELVFFVGKHFLKWSVITYYYVDDLALVTTTITNPTILYNCHFLYEKLTI